MKFVESIPTWLLVMACLTLGLAPYVPQPHVVEKLGLLMGGRLQQPMDVFDILLHLTPWVLLLLRLGLLAKTRWGQDGR